MKFNKEYYGRLDSFIEYNNGDIEFINKEKSKNLFKSDYRIFEDIKSIWVLK